MAFTKEPSARRATIKARGAGDAPGVLASGHGTGFRQAVYRSWKRLCKGEGTLMRSGLRGRKSTRLGYFERLRAAGVAI